MKYIFLFLIILFTTSCGGKSYTHLVDPIINSYSKEMNKKRGYRLGGTGGSMSNDDIRSVFLSLHGNQLVDISGARHLYVEVVEGLIKKLNSDKIIRPYLHDYPATFKNADIHLVFNDIEGNPVCKNNISFVSYVNGKIYYRIYDYYKIPRYTIVYEEPYEEALRIIKEEQASSNNVN